MPRHLQGPGLAVPETYGARSKLSRPTLRVPLFIVARD
jgi:hypothetical protein